MSYAIMSSGGKDGTLAFDRAKRLGYDVRYLANIYEGTTDRVRFHGVRRDLIAAQAQALGLEPVLHHTSPKDFEPVFLELLDELGRRGCRGAIFGNIHLHEVRTWYEERVTGAGLEHVELLWGEPSMELVYEIVERGYHGLLVSVDLSRPAKKFLGRELDADLLTDIGITDNLDPAGEEGEFHTFIYDGPEFLHPVEFDVGEVVDIEGHRFLDLVPVK